MRHTLIFILCFAAISGSGQRIVDVGKSDAPISALYYAVGGEPVSLVKYVKVVEGTPYFSEDWLDGSLIVSGGRKYDTVLLKLDLLAHELQYLDNDGNALVATTPVTEIWINDKMARRLHFFNASFLPAPDGGSVPLKAWLQLLTDGPYLLFKEHSKQISESKAYGSGIVEQTISTKFKYYIFAGGKLSYVKKIGEVPDILGNKKDELEKYIKSNRLSGKTEGDYISLISYYNSIASK